jgi:hypothetical protein
LEFSDVRGMALNRLLGWRSELIFLLLVGGSHSASAQCNDKLIRWSGAYIIDTSNWSEVDASGHRLVTESGRLAGTELSGQFHCNSWDYAAVFSDVSGTRDYDGQTSSGFQVTSNSQVRKRELQLKVGFDVSQHWQVGGRLSHLTIWRDIASAGGASGYPEQFDFSMLSIGSNWHSEVGRGQLRLAAWIEQPLMSKMTINLPGSDQATLPLGNVKQLDLSVAWRYPLSAAWSLEADLGYRRTEIGQGEDVVLMRNGLPVYMAHQPKTVTDDRSMTMRIEYLF